MAFAGSAFWNHRWFDTDRLARNEETVRREFWGKARRVAARLPFAEDLLAAYYCALDRETPTQVRAALFGALAYFVLPFDALPDMLVGLGYTDDAAVMIAAFTAAKVHITEAHRERARAWLLKTRASQAA
jgi:uncharacterized membrane protein YkvA (DUF1232 family)